MSCGPTNALQKLSNHSQVDRSLQQDPQHRLQAANNQFRTQHANTLDREFQQHQQGMQNFDPMFQSAFQGPAHPFAQQPMRQAPAPSAGASSWANDFKMNNNIQQGPQQSQGWNAQFMNQMNSQQSISSQSQAQAQQQMQHHLQQSRLNSSMMYTPQLMQNQSLSGLSRMTEHQQLHSAHLQSQMSDLGEFDALDKEFDKLEQEFKNVKMQEPEMKKAEMELPMNNNAGFREAAKQVADVMKTSENNKFANSKFLDLMNRVSVGQVQLNQDESKLVDTQGRDIHEMSTQAQESVHTYPSSQQQASTSQESSSQQQSRLPDPLEFVKDGTLETPFQAAKLVGQQHQEKYTWDDMYEDYRHDDTSF